MQQTSLFSLTTKISMTFIYNSKSFFTLRMLHILFITSTMLQIDLYAPDVMENLFSTILQMHFNCVATTSYLIPSFFLFLFPFFLFHSKLGSSFKTMGNITKQWIATRVQLAFYHIILVFSRLRWTINIMSYEALW